METKETTETKEMTELEIALARVAELEGKLATATKFKVIPTTKHAIVAKAIEKIATSGTTHFTYEEVLAECKVLGFVNSHEIFTILKQQSQSSQIYFPKRSFSLPQERDSWNK